MTDSTSKRSSQALRSFLTSRWFPLQVALLGVLLLLPTAIGGFKTDDLVQRYTMVGNAELSALGFPLTEKAADLPEALSHYFTFFHPEVEGHNNAQRDFGTVPWWMDTEMKLSLFRPVTALTHWIDYQLWPDQPQNMHLHSLVWLGGWLLLAGLLFRRFIGVRAAAGLATLMFMLDYSYRLPATWIANRNALICGFLGLLTIYLHDRWRARGKHDAQGDPRRWHWAVLAQVALLLTLLSAEAGLGITAYLFAYALCIESGPIGSRIRSLVPATGVVIVWRAVYVMLGFGAARTDMYIDPGVNPLRFLSALVTRGPVLLFSQLAAWDEFTTSMAPDLRFKVWLGILVALLLLGWAFYPLLKTNKTARFFMVGSLISLVPLPAYAAMQGRLLIFVSFGMMGFLGLFIASVFKKKEVLSVPTEGGSASAGQGVFARFVAGLMVFVHLFLGGLVKVLFFLIVLSGMAGDILTTTTLEQKPLQSILSGLGVDGDAAERQIILVNPPTPFLFAYFPYYMAWHNEIAPEDERVAFPKGVRMLTTGLTPIEIERVDAHTLKVRPEGGYLIPPEQRTAAEFSNAPRKHLAYTLRLQGHDFRVPKLSPLVLGDQVRLPGMTVEVSALTEDQRPAEATFYFEQQLDDPSLVWLYWSYEAQEPSMHLFDFKSLTLPNAGEKITLNGPFGAPLKESL